MGVLRYFSMPRRSEEHTSELQSLTNLVCRLLLEKKKYINKNSIMFSPIFLSPLFFFKCSADHRDLHSFPTRRSSDLFQPRLHGCSVVRLIDDIVGPRRKGSFQHGGFVISRVKQDGRTSIFLHAAKIGRAHV